MDKYRDIDISSLTTRQREVLSLFLDGKMQTEIADILGCSKQNVSIILKTISSNITKPKDKITKTKRENEPKVKKVRKVVDVFSEDREKYKDSDLSILALREREVLRLRISGKTYGQIADELNISTSAVGVMLGRARSKLDGKETQAQKYFHANRKKIYAKRKENSQYIEKQKMYHEMYYQKNLGRIREYNSEYYKKNREKILGKKKTET